MFRFGRISGALLALFVLLVLVACESDDDDPLEPPEPVATVLLSRTQQGLLTGETVRIEATPLDRNGAALSDRTVVWRSENTAVATVSAAGVVTARAVGSTGVVAASEGREARVAVVVTAPPPDEVASVELTPSALALTVGQTRELTATPRDAHGTPIQGRAVEWSVANEAIARVSPQGVLTAIGVGTTQVGVKVENRFAHADVTVDPPPTRTVESVTLDAVALALEEGATRQLVATPRDAVGDPIEGLGKTWTSSDENVARVDAAGKVSANAAGAALVTVRVHGKSASVPVTVTANAAHDLVFARWSGTTSELFRLDLRVPGATPARVLPAGVNAVTPKASPDGSKLAFAATLDGITSIWVVDRDGANRRRVAPWEHGVPTEPTWSPDGSKLAYTVARFDGSGTDIWVVTLGDLSSAVNLTADVEGANQYMPAWSPTLADGGSRIAYVQPIGGMHRIWTMRPDGTGKRQVTSGASDIQPAWSPDGGTIAYQKSGVAIFGDIWLVRPDGSNDRALMPFHALPGPQWAPQFSPDGRMIAFTSAHETYGSGSPVQQVYTYRLDGGGLARRTGPDAFEKATPVWMRR